MKVVIILILALVSLSACESDKYSKVAIASGKWMPANADPSSTDNNISPLLDDKGLAR